jgi:hypothetical protein
VGPRWESRAREILVTNINDNLPHSRPNRATLMIAVGLILGVAVIVFWPQISAFPIFPKLGMLSGSDGGLSLPETPSG